jgi:hypothetical protein
VAHACDPSFSGGTDQEDCSSKQLEQKSLGDPISKKENLHKRAGGVAQGICSEFKPKYHKKKKHFTSTKVIKF